MLFLCNIIQIANAKRQKGLSELSVTVAMALARMAVQYKGPAETMLFSEVLLAQFKFTMSR